MSTALDRAALELKPKLDKYGIEVPLGERVIVYDGLVVNVKFGTPQKDCLRKLRKLIKLAEKKEFQRTQGALL